MHNFTNPRLFLLTVTLVFFTQGILGSKAYASRARTLVMGTSDPLRVTPHGSLYYDDANNILYNPAYANNFKNFVVIEKSNERTTFVSAQPNPGGVANSGTLSALANEAEGGFITQFLRVNFGMYLNRGDAISGTYNNSSPVRPIDLILASDAPIKWGVALTTASNKSSAANTGADTTLRAGVIISDLEPFAAFKIYGVDQTAGGTDRNRYWIAGLKYHWGEWAPFAIISRHSFRPNSGAGGISNNMGLGFARNTQLSDLFNMNFAFSYWRAINSGAGNAGSGNWLNNGAHRSVIPFDISIEGEALPWLTARAGLSYSITDRLNGLSNSSAASGRIGAAFKFNKLVFDWAMGSKNISGTATTQQDGDGKTIDLSNGFFTAASMTYNW